MEERKEGREEGSKEVRKERERETLVPSTKLLQLSQSVVSCLVLSLSLFLSLSLSLFLARSLALWVNGMRGCRRGLVEGRVGVEMRKEDEEPQPPH